MKYWVGILMAAAFLQVPLAKADLIECRSLKGAAPIRFSAQSTYPYHSLTVTAIYDRSGKPVLLQKNQLEGGSLTSGPFQGKTSYPYVVALADQSRQVGQVILPSMFFKQPQLFIGFLSDLSGLDFERLACHLAFME